MTSERKKRDAFLSDKLTRAGGWGVRRRHRGTASPNLLQSGHPRIQPPAADELLVRAALDEHAAIDDEDLRRVSHGGQPMRHHERAALPVTLPRTEGALHQLLRCGVERSGRLQKESTTWVVACKVRFTIILDMQSGSNAIQSKQYVEHVHTLRSLGRASSSSSKRGAARSARAMAMRSRCPPESCTPRSPTWSSFGFGFRSGLVLGLWLGVGVG